MLCENKTEHWKSKLVISGKLKRSNTGFGSAVVLLGAPEKPALEKVAPVQVEGAGGEVQCTCQARRARFQVEPVCYSPRLWSSIFLLQPYGPYPASVAVK